jgi:hypothetical protein
MMLAIAALLAAGMQVAPAARPDLQVATAPAQQGPWLSMQAGPSFAHQGGLRGLSSGPLVRLGVGAAFTDVVGGELWLSGALESAPLSTPGDAAIAALGLGARLRLHRFDAEGKLALWAHAGAGWQAAVAGSARSGPAGFAGAELLFQPFVRRFAIGVELDGLASRGTLGFALLPSLRCAL